MELREGQKDALIDYASRGDHDRLTTYVQSLIDETVEMDRAKTREGEAAVTAPADTILVLMRRRFGIGKLIGDYEETREALVRAANEVSPDVVRALMNLCYGVSKLADMPVEDYADFRAQLEALRNAFQRP